MRNLILVLATLVALPAYADLSLMKGHESELLGYFGAARPQDRAIHLGDLEAFGPKLVLADLMLNNPDRTEADVRLARQARETFLQQALASRIFSQVLDAEADRLKLPALVDDRRVRCALHYFMSGQKGHDIADAEAPSAYLVTVKEYAALGLTPQSQKTSTFPIDWKKAATKVARYCAQESSAESSSIAVRSLPETYEGFDQGVQDALNWEHRVARRQSTFNALMGQIGRKYAMLSNFETKAQRGERIAQRMDDDRAVERMLYDLFAKYPVTGGVRLCSVSELPCLKFGAQSLTQILMSSRETVDLAIQGGWSELVMPVMGGRPASAR